MRILVVEDEKELCNTIAEGLELENYAVDTCYDGEEAYLLLETEPYDLVILDLNLPGMDGLDILKKIRNNNKKIHILILSARNSIFDKVTCLDNGASDFLEKPFEFAELEARVRSLLRRTFIQEDTVLKWNEISLDTLSKQVFINDKKIKLTRKEFGILHYFLLNQDKVISQEELMDHVWNSELDSFSNVVRTHISSLRRKLKDELLYNPIKTKIGAGYILKVGGKDVK